MTIQSKNENVSSFFFVVVVVVVFVLFGKKKKRQKGKTDLLVLFYTIPIL